MSDHNVKISPCRLIGLAGALFIIIGAIAIGGGAMVFIHIPSLALTLGVAFFALLATFGTDFLKFIPRSFLTFVTQSPAPNPKFAEIALFASRYIIGSALIATLIGFIQMLQNLSDPNSLGSGMAVALLSIFYALVVSEIFCAFLYKAYSADDDAKETKPLPLRNAALPVTVVSTVILIFLVLLMSFTQF